MIQIHDKCTRTKFKFGHWWCILGMTTPVTTMHPCIFGCILRLQTEVQPTHSPTVHHDQGPNSKTSSSSRQRPFACGRGGGGHYWDRHRGGSLDGESLGRTAFVPRHGHGKSPGAASIDDDDDDEAACLEPCEGAGTRRGGGRIRRASRRTMAGEGT